LNGGECLTTIVAEGAVGHRAALDLAIQMIPTVKEEVDNVPTSNMYAYQLQALLTKSYQNNVTSVQKLLDSDTWMFKLTYKDVAEDLLQRYNSVFSYLNRKTLDD